MQLKIITSTTELDGCKESWNEVVESSSSFPFFRWEWMIQWINAQSNVKPCVLVAAQGNEWVGIAPFCVESKPGKLVRKLKFLGSGCACSDYAGLISGPENFDQFAELTADWLAENTRSQGVVGEIDALEFEGVAADDSNQQYFFELLDANGFKSCSVPLEGCWALELPESWDELNSQLSKKLRRKTKKAIRRLEAEKTTVLSTEDRAFEELWPTFVALHQRRREMLGQPGCFANPEFESFLKNATGQLASEKRAELVVVESEGNPLASFLLFFDKRSAYMYQSGLCPDKIKQEPGYQIIVLALQRSIDKGFQRFDFLRGDEPYKSRWLTKRVDLVTQRFVPRKLKSQLCHTIWWTGRSLKEYWRQHQSTSG